MQSAINKLHMAQEYLKELADQKEQLYSLASSLEAELHPGDDKNCDHIGAWRLSQVLREILESVSLTNGCKDYLAEAKDLLSPQATLASKTEKATKAKSRPFSLDLQTVDTVQAGLGDVEAMIGTIGAGIEDDDYLARSLWAIEKIQTRTKKIFDLAVSRTNK